MSNELNLSSVLSGETPELQPTQQLETTGEEIGISIVQDDSAPKTINLVSPRKPMNVSPSNSGRVLIDPSAFAPKVEKPQENTINPQFRRESMAIGDLDKAIDRKKEEFHIAMKDLADKDRTNRMAIAEELESVEGETQYLLTPKTSINVDSAIQDVNFDEEMEKELDEIERNSEIYVKEQSKPIKVYQPIVPAVEETVHPEPKTVIAETDTTTDEEFEVEVKESLASDGFDENGKSEGFNDTIVGELKIKPSVPEIPTVSDLKKEDIINTGIDEEDFSDLDDLDEDEEKTAAKKEEEALQTKGLKNLQSEILNKVIHAANKFDVSTFKVSKKPASITQAINASAKKIKETATWPLMNVERPYVSSALTGPEIVMINAVDEENSVYIANMQQIKILYNHDENPYKPSTVEAWAKTIPYADIDNIFMAAYIATFSKANFIPYVCESKKCGHMELKTIDDIINTMVKFKNEKSREKFNRLRETVLSPEHTQAYEEVIVPINYEYSIGFKMPSIYNMMVELRSVNPTFLEKYASIITVITYIDTIYLNDHDNGEFKPIEYKIYPNDVEKTFKSKIATYAKILNKMDREYDAIMVYINSLDARADDIEKFIIPEEKCSKCGAVIKETQTTPKDMVFIHQRLVDIAAITTE